MSRKPRLKSKTGIYIVYIKWADKLEIIKNDNDFISLTDCIRASCSKYEYKVYAYTFNKEYAGIVLRENTPEGCSRFIQSFLSAYSAFYNKKYSRSGKIIKDRFKSIPIENTSLLPEIAAYLHNLSENPVYSSIPEYFESKTILCDTDALLFLVNNSLEQFKKLHAEISGIPKEYRYSVKRNNKEICELIKNTVNIKPGEIKHLAVKERNTVLKTLRTDAHITIGELQKATGISRGIITRSVKNDENIPKSQDEIWLL